MEAKHVHAEATKAFFVHTITRDIKLEDCILDLIDNSLDGARNMLGNPVPSLNKPTDFSKYKVEIQFSDSEFIIRDNCGGIPLDDAINYAFTFGRMDTDTPDSYSIGVYGIGMKRAIFKLGKLIDVKSTRPNPKKGAPEEPFVVKIDVPKWLAAKSWDFDLDEASTLGAPGVEISIRELNENISVEFSNPSFENRLRRIVGRDYARFIDHGLSIVINGKRVKAFDFNLLTNEHIKPFRGEFNLKGVKIEIISGMAAPPSDSGAPEEEGEKEDRSGWYILCNDRMVVAADKSELTGWGYNGQSRWHPQYRGFIGIILFSAPLASLLPLTTTKRSIDRDHEVYRLSLGRMMEQTSTWIAYTNSRKNALEEAKAQEKGATQTPAFAAPISPTVNRGPVYPVLTATPRDRETTIQYAKLIKSVRRLAQGMGNPALSAREVGIRSFDYTYRELVGEED